LRGGKGGTFMVGPGRLLASLRHWGRQGTTGPTLATTCFYCTNAGLFHCAIWVYLKSLNGSLQVTVEHRHLGR